MAEKKDMLEELFKKNLKTYFKCPYCLKNLRVLPYDYSREYTKGFYMKCYNKKCNCYKNSIYSLTPNIDTPVFRLWNYEERTWVHAEDMWEAFCERTRIQKKV